MIFAPSLVVNPPFIILISYIMYQDLGWVALIAVGIMLLITVVASVAATFSGKKRSAIKLSYVYNHIIKFKFLLTELGKSGQNFVFCSLWFQKYLSILQM